MFSSVQFTYMPPTENTEIIVPRNHFANCARGALLPVGCSNWAGKPSGVRAHATPPRSSRDIVLLLPTLALATPGNFVSAALYIAVQTLPHQELVLCFAFPTGLVIALSARLR